MELLAASTMYELGQETLSQIDNQVSISPKVGTNLHVEPIPIVDIKKFRDDYPYFLSEVFHGKLVQLWNNCLRDIFSLFIDLHFTGKRNFEELGKLSIKLDFSSDENFYSQIQNRIIDDFDFKKYRYREKIINKILNLNDVGRDEIAAIHKNVLIRNAIQHKNGVIDSYTIKELGSSQIKILDMNGKINVYKENDKILLSIPEIYSFKSSILSIGQIWRVNDD
jgi:hypothetical protein